MDAQIILPLCAVARVAPAVPSRNNGFPQLHGVRIERLADDRAVLVATNGAILAADLAAGDDVLVARTVTLRLPKRLPRPKNQAFVVAGAFGAAIYEAPKADAA